MAHIKTTVEIPDDLFREAKSQAALRRTKLKELVAEGLRLVLSGNVGQGAPRRVEFPIIKAKPGAPILTKKMVDEVELQMLREEAEHHAKLVRR